MTNKIELLGLDRQELEADLKEHLGLESYRAKQIISWVYRERVHDFEPMTDISKDARKKLAERYQISRPKIITRQISKDGTRKYLFELADGERIESVLIAQTKRNTLCVSSQVGCAIGCKFCRTALMGLKRHLKTHEILGQVLAVKEDAPEDFSNLVFMGMGEPLHNLDNVTRAVRILNDDLGLYMAPRKITISTSGLVPAIKKLAEVNIPARLAVSLNATDNETRTRLIPINKKFPLEVLFKALHDYPADKRRCITIEYVMLRDVNDTVADLKRLPKLLKGLHVKLNLIPYNENAGLGFHAPTDENIQRWQKTLLSAGINTRIRWSKGEDIDAACGQLQAESAN